MLGKGLPDPLRSNPCLPPLPELQRQRELREHPVPFAGAGQQGLGAAALQIVEQHVSRGVAAGRLSPGALCPLLVPSSLPNPSAPSVSAQEYSKMNYLDILVRASIDVTAATENIKLPHAGTQVRWAPSAPGAKPPGLASSRCPGPGAQDMLPWRSFHSTATPLRRP